MDVELSDAETTDFINNIADHLSDVEIIDYNPDVEFVQQRPSHSRDRLRHRQKQKQNEVKFLKKVPQHPRDMLKTKTKKKRI